MKRQLQITLWAAVAVTSLAGLPLANAAITETKTQRFAYDANSDGIIEPEEFTTYVYKRSDIDNDGFLGDEEWQMMSSYWYRPYKDIDTNTYTYWDQDKDSHLDSNEVDTLIQKTGLYSRWDIDHDGKVDNSEFVQGTFLAYDDNANGEIDMNEWADVIR